MSPKNEGEDQKAVKQCTEVNCPKDVGSFQMVVMAKNRWRCRQVRRLIMMVQPGSLMFAMRMLRQSGRIGYRKCRQ